jgi:hypothetical protein
MNIGLAVLMSALVAALWSSIASLVRLFRRPTQFPGSLRMPLAEGCAVSLAWIGSRMVTNGAMTQELIVLGAICGLTWFLAARSYQYVVAKVVHDEF